MVSKQCIPDLFYFPQLQNPKPDLTLRKSRRHQKYALHNSMNHSLRAAVSSLLDPWCSESHVKLSGSSLEDPQVNEALEDVNPAVTSLFDPRFNTNHQCDGSNSSSSMDHKTTPTGQDVTPDIDSLLSFNKSLHDVRLVSSLIDNNDSIAHLDVKPDVSSLLDPRFNIAHQVDESNSSLIDSQDDFTPMDVKPCISRLLNHEVTLTNDEEPFIPSSVDPLADMTYQDVVADQAHTVLDAPNVTVDRTEASFLDGVHSESATALSLFHGRNRVRGVNELQSLTRHLHTSTVGKSGQVQEDYEDQDIDEPQPANYSNDIISNTLERKPVIKKELLDEDDDFFSYDQNLQETKVELEQNEHQCKYCLFRTTNRPNLRRHERFHTGKRVLQCKSCDFITTHAGHMRSHERKHSGDWLKCEHCDYQTAQAGHLKAHMRKHNGNMLKCSHCDYQSAHLCNLKVHLRKHTGEYFKCSYCDFENICERYLRKHERIHTGNLLKCEFCDYKSIRYDAIKLHIRIKHTGYTLKCNSCDFETSYSSSMRIHERKHTGIQLECNDCDFKTFHPRSLRRHEKQHSKSNRADLLKCKDCDYETFRLDNMKKHERRHKDNGAQYKRKMEPKKQEINTITEVAFGGECVQSEPP